MRDADNIQGIYCQNKLELKTVGKASNLRSAPIIKPTSPPIIARIIFSVVLKNLFM